MAFDILGEVQKFAMMLHDLAEDHWQICIAGTVLLIGYIVYLLVF